MTSERLRALEALLAQDPGNDFARYGLAMEWAKAGQWERAAAEFRILLERNPDYAAAYYQAGQVLERLGRIEEARQVYRKGIEVHTRQGNRHAREEIQAALDRLD